MEQETSDFKQSLKESRKYRWMEGGEGEEPREDRAYTQKFETVCPVDSSKVIHTVRFLKSTCTRVDDIVDDFHCNRNGSCVKCMENYR